MKVVERREKETAVLGREKGGSLTTAYRKRKTNSIEPVLV
jgi:hypothetical protein